MQKLRFFAEWPSQTWTWILLIAGLIFTIFFNVVTSIQLGKAEYPETELLGPFPSWWFSFSGSELKSHYAILVNQGTIDTFITQQYLDYGLMFFTGLFFFILTLYVARKHKDDSWRRFGFIGAFLFPAAACMDAIENASLLIMLSNPQGFPNWLAIVYSSFASIKVSLFVIGFIWLMLTLVALIVKKVTK